MRPPDREDAADHGRAIAEVAARLSGPCAELARRVGASAARVVAAIEACDVERTWLETHAGTGVIDRLSAQLAALESANTTSPDAGELTQLLRRELELTGRMRAGLDHVAQRRTRLLSLLRGVWTHLATVRDAQLEEREIPHAAIADLSSLDREIASVLDENA